MINNVLALTFLLSVYFSTGQIVPKKINESDFSIGKTITIKSNVLQEDRVLNIYLPVHYSLDSLKNYPVIYLLDGSMDEDIIHVSGIVQFCSFSWINSVPESIVVGIANVDRKRDFTSPSQSPLDQKEFTTAGKSESFIKFLHSELQPFIDSSFRTTNEKTIIGQSLGGLLATEILWTKPELFDNYLIVSPSLWWNDEKLLQTPPVPYPSVKSIYIAVGKEGEFMERLARELFDKLQSTKRENTNITFSFMDDKTHGDALHNAVYQGLQTIFSN